jgi:hypothetical protein
VSGQVGFQVGSGRLLDHLMSDHFEFRVET